MGLATPESAILSAVIFNALIIVALIPLALKGISYRPRPAADGAAIGTCWVYGLGGLIAPFIGIKAIDLIITDSIPGIGLSLVAFRRPWADVKQEAAATPTAGRLSP